MKSIYKALAGFQQDIKPIFKGSTGYGYSYTDLGEIYKAINPLLKKHGLGFIQPIRGRDLHTIVFHVESGETIEGFVEIKDNVTLKGMNDYQVMGSAITYLRRYCLASMLGLVTDSDLDATGKQYETLEEIKNDYANKLITQAQATRAKEELQKRQENGTK